HLLSKERGWNFGFQRRDVRGSSPVLAIPSSTVGSVVYKMFRFPRPKLVAEFAVFFFLATAFIQLALYFTTGRYVVYSVAAPSPSAMVDIFAASPSHGEEAGEQTSSSGQSHAGRNDYPSGGIHQGKVDRGTAKDETGNNHNDPLQNISKPYFTVVTDKGFKINSTYFRLRPTRVSQIPDTFPISSKTVCAPASPRLLFMVPSVASPQAAAERSEIRKTWASTLYGPTWRQTSAARIAFFFGGAGLNAKQMTHLREESIRYGDIVVGDFVDSYQNLSLKMATIITWAARCCPSLKAAVKIDMDTYVNVDLLSNLLERLSGTQSSYVFGHMHAWTNPSVVRSGQWAVPVALYPYNKFPRYIYGHSYVISGPALKLMADAFPAFPIVPNEDAFVTGIMTNVLNITRLHHDSFAFLLEKRTLCDMTRGAHVTAVMKTENRMKLWNSFKSKTCLDVNL
ncbi:hypothetical protein EGW08_009458, partial [Elysia chlorotica]